MINFEELKKNKEILTYLKKGNENLMVLGYTDHSVAHTMMVANRAAYILERLGYDNHKIELVKIAGFMHDIGNSINRKNHAEYGALLADKILKDMDISIEDRIDIISAIGHHDESTGGARDVISAALIIADKTDVRRNRVVHKDRSTFDIHDNVNYAVTSNKLIIEQKKIILELEVDESICTMYEYFDIFLNRMLMSRQAAEMLSATFNLYVNGSKIL